MDIGSGYSVVEKSLTYQAKEEKPQPNYEHIPELQIVPVETENTDYNSRRIQELEKELGIQDGLEDLIDDESS